MTVEVTRQSLHLCLMATHAPMHTPLGVLLAFADSANPFCTQAVCVCVSALHASCVCVCVCVCACVCACPPCMQALCVSWPGHAHAPHPWELMHVQHKPLELMHMRHTPGSLCTCGTPVGAHARAAQACGAYARAAHPWEPMHARACASHACMPRLQQERRQHQQL